MPELQPPAGYVRVSLFLAGSVSDEAQKSEITELAERRGLPSPVFYIDVDRSASDERKPRPEFDRLMADVKSGKVQIIIARSSDRFVRRPRELESIIDILSPTKVPVYFTRDSDYDLSTASGRENARIKASIARGEVERMSERMKSSSVQRFKEGIPRKGNRPFGYQYSTTSKGITTLVEDAAEAASIRWAYEYLSSGGTLMAVAKEWNARKVFPTRLASNWSWTGVKQAMLNPSLGGFRYYRPATILGVKQYKPPPWECEMTSGNWKGILTADQWRGLKTTLTATRSQAGNHLRYLGSGIFLCDKCADGTTMTSGGRTNGRSGKHMVYKCRKSNHVIVPGEGVDKFVLDMIRRALTSKKTFDGVFKQASQVDSDDIKAQKAKLTKKLDELAEAYASDSVSISAYERASARIESEIKELDDILAGVQSTKERLTRLMSFKEIDSALETVDLTQQRQLMQDIFPTIRILSAGRGNTFDPERHIKLTDRTGQVWPDWFQGRKDQSSLVWAMREEMGMSQPNG